jgi:hypothetical protein
MMGCKNFKSYAVEVSMERSQKYTNRWKMDFVCSVLSDIYVNVEFNWLSINVFWLQFILLYASKPHITFV